MLQDGIELAQGSKAVHLVVESGATFPTSPLDGQHFRLTAVSGAYSPDEYWYDAASSTWVSGDISGVVAGTGLLGGGTRGSVSLSLDSNWLDGHSMPLSGGAMAGALTLHADPATALEAATKQYVDSSLQNINTFLSKTGGTMTGPLAVLDPTAPSHAVNKAYVDILAAFANTLLSRAGGTMTGALVLSSDPTQPLHAVTKQYVDALGTKYQDMIVSMSQPGDLATVVGTARWYPPKAIKILDIQAFVGVQCTGTPIHLDIKNKGVSVLGSPVEILVAQNFSNAYMIPDGSNLLSVTDYLTLDVTQIGSILPGADLAVRIRYNYQ
jgi:hypothetical protein